MRRKDREVADFLKMTKIMNDCDCCRLGFVDGNEAYIVPMNFGCDIINKQIFLYFHCANEGRKIDLLPKQSAVSFEMDTGRRLIEGSRGCDFSYSYQCIMGTGELKMISNMDEKIYGLQKITAHYSTKTQWEFDANILNSATVLKLSVQSWSCKERKFP